MKKIITLGVLALLAPMTFAQTIDNLAGDLLKVGGALVNSGQAKRERAQLDRVTRELNADQPQVAIRNMRIVARIIGGWYGDERSGGKTSDERILTANGARPVWDDNEIDEESASRDKHERNRWVDPGTKPAEKTIKLARLILESERKRFEKFNDMRIWLNSFLRRSLDLGISRETNYTVLTHKYRDKDTGEVVAIYRTIGSASSADNVFANLGGGGLFGSSVGTQISGDSYEDRAFRADMSAEAKMKLLLKEKAV